MGDLNNDIERYLRGEMTPAEMHALEKKALSDPFLADALEGGAMSENLSRDVKEINEKIRPRKSYTLRIAAGVVVVIGASLFFLWPQEEKVQLSQEKQETKTDTIVKDSVAKEPLPKPEEKKLAVKKLPKPEKQTVVVVPEETKRDTTTIAVVEEPVEIIKPATHLVSGTVTTAEDKLPLPGVSVLIKGTTTGTTTDVAGNYAIEVPDTSSLVFSFVGMHQNETEVADKNTIDIKMTEDVSQLSEVVIARAPMPTRKEATSDIKLAEPVGGIKAYDKYLEANKRYPQQALDNDVKGRVIVGFDVGLQGELSNFVVIRSLGYGCDDEVIRLIKEGPAWNPTVESNVPVESTIHVKLKFDAAKVKKKR